eukprot:TRINITY_DN48946_c0_g1_i1.p1 TRINITY_DN48946_c0_g1~~TRINITY_DN48946_c0_g1_i1.p1  ORF type:complete len:642 (-),score=173.74 TRINITY_DN48946_c0_g1_i1:63-1988(-)
MRCGAKSAKQQRARAEALEREAVAVALEEAEARAEARDERLAEELAETHERHRTLSEKLEETSVEVARGREETSAVGGEELAEEEALQSITARVAGLRQSVLTLAEQYEEHEARTVAEETSVEEEVQALDAIFTERRGLLCRIELCQDIGDGEDDDDSDAGSVTDSGLSSGADSGGMFCREDTARRRRVSGSSLGVGLSASRSMRTKGDAEEEADELRCMLRRAVDVPQRYRNEARAFVDQARILVAGRNEVREAATAAREARQRSEAEVHKLQAELGSLMRDAMVEDDLFGGGVVPVAKTAPALLKVAAGGADGGSASAKKGTADFGGSANAASVQEVWKLEVEQREEAGRVRNLEQTLQKRQELAVAAAAVAAAEAAAAAAAATKKPSNSPLMGQAPSDVDVGGEVGPSAADSGQAVHEPSRKVLTRPSKGAAPAVELIAENRRLRAEAEELRIAIERAKEDRESLLREEKRASQPLAAVVGATRARLRGAMREQLQSSRKLLTEMRRDIESAASRLQRERRQREACEAELQSLLSVEAHASSTCPTDLRMATTSQRAAAAAAAAALASALPTPLLCSPQLPSARSSVESGRGRVDMSLHRGSHLVGSFVSSSGSSSGESRRQSPMRQPQRSRSSSCSS